MARAGSWVDQAGAQAQQAGREVMRAPRAMAEGAAASPTLTKLARLGLAAKGVIYATIGGLAVKAALGSGGQTTDTRGAIQEIGQQPFGQVLLGLLALGLVGYALWRFVQALADTEGKGGKAKGLAVRAGYFGSGILHAGLAVWAVKLLLGSASSRGSGGGNQTQDWTAKLMDKPFGVWLVALVGAGVIGYGLWQLWIAYKAKFRKRFNLGSMSAEQQTWATRVGRFGYAARGVVFGIIGTFLILAALHSNPSEAKGLSGALQALQEQSHGPWLLGLVAFGLVAYGLYSFVEARYRRLGTAESH